jgi:formate hydrogenlyase subunit 4
MGCVAEGDDEDIPGVEFNAVYYVEHRGVSWRDALQFFGLVALSLLGVYLGAALLPATTPLVWRVLGGILIVLLVWAAVYAILSLVYLRRGRLRFRQMTRLATDDPEEFRRRFGPPNS